MNDQREKMYQAAAEKYGPEFAMKTGVTAFDRDEARPAERSEVAEFDVELDGKLIGKTRVVGTLDHDVIERNIGWMPRMYCGSGVWVYTDELEKIEVDKEAGVVRLTKKATS